MDKKPPACTMASAIGRSKTVPSFFKSAGARLTVILLAGSVKPLFLRAVKILLLLSLIAVSGRPTM